MLLGGKYMATASREQGQQRRRGIRRSVPLVLALMLIISSALAAAFTQSSPASAAVTTTSDDRLSVDVVGHTTADGTEFTYEFTNETADIRIYRTWDGKDAGTITGEGCTELGKPTEDTGWAQDDAGWYIEPGTVARLTCSGESVDTAKVTVTDLVYSADGVTKEGTSPKVSATAEVSPRPTP